jgi:hypothetical protein
VKNAIGPCIPSSGYVWYCRGLLTRELLRNKTGAFRLLALIAARTRYCDSAPNPHELRVGECVIGRSDHRECGLTEKQYRTAQKVLDRWKIVSFQATTRGTIATILNRAVFDPLTGYELVQLKGQPEYERNYALRVQVNGQQTATSRTSRRARNGPIINNDNNEKKVRTSTRIYELTEQNKAIDAQVEAIHKDKSNFHRLIGTFQDTLKPESRRAVKELREKKARNIAELTGL